MMRHIQAAAFATIGDHPLANLATYGSVYPHLVIVRCHLEFEVAQTPWPGVVVEAALVSHHALLYLE